jgi:hypothetical protein
MTMASVTTPSSSPSEASYSGDPSRLTDLDLMAEAYAALSLAIGWTRGNVGDDAKVCGHGWDREKPMSNPDWHRGMMTRIVRKNPVLVTRNSGVVGIDIDGPSAGEHLHRIAGDLPATITVLSGRDGGMHLWFAPSEGRAGCKVEVKDTGTVTLSGNGYLVIPPALHSNGRQYRFAADRAPWDVGMAVLPADIHDALAHAAGESRRKTSADGAPIPDGERNGTLTALAGAVRRHGATRTEMLALLTAVNDERCKPPLSRVELERIAASIARYAPADVPRVGVNK